MPERTDEALVRDIQDGDIFAFELLVKRYQRKLHAFVSRMVFDYQQSQDIVQESFISLYKTIDRVDPAQKFSSYVFSITRNTAISHMRKRRAEISLEDIEIAEEDESLYSQLVQADDKDRIQKALMLLDPKYRTVIKLYYFDDLSYEEISASMHIPVNTVRTHLRRAKDILRKHLS